MITRFHATGASAGSAKWWYVLRIPTTIPESPSRTTIGKRTRESPTARSKSPPGSPNGRMSSGASRMKTRGDAAEDEERQPEERRGDAPGALLLARARAAR